MIRLTESAIEDFAIKLFERLGYTRVVTYDVNSVCCNEERVAT
ncbi:hypothetical protein [Sulfuriferula sp. AH1]|nr:hypothetical protein [Sulfuriferula sp. AH1]